MDNIEKENFEKSINKMEEKYGKAQMGDMMDAILDMMCMSGNKKANAFKKYHDIINTLHDVTEKYLMDSLDDEEKVNEYYNFITALKEQTTHIINDFTNKMEK